MTERSEVIIRISPPGQAGSSQPGRAPASHYPNNRNHSEEPE
jgi:hypothetical protein